MIENLEDIKVGDKVLLQGRYGDIIVPVQRITQTQIVIEKYGKFSRKNGRSVGTDTWSTKWIRHVTDSDVQKFHLRDKRIAVRTMIGQIDYDKLTAEQCDKLSDILKQITSNGSSKQS